MTTTDIGIALIVLCILLWAIMAALHRHTVQLEALKTQLQELLKAQQAESGHAEAPPRSTARRDDAETRVAAPARSEPTVLPTRHTLPK